jgi:hypothetical protein
VEIGVVGGGVREGGRKVGPRAWKGERGRGSVEKRFVGLGGGGLVLGWGGRGEVLMSNTAGKRWKGGGERRRGELAMMGGGGVTRMPPCVLG